MVKMSEGHNAENDATVALVGGLFDGRRVALSATPPRISVGGVIYEQITDPDAGAFLGGYVIPPGSDHA